MPKAHDEGRKEPSLVTFTQAAKWVVDFGYVPNMTPEGLRKIARTDPEWTVGAEDYEQVANARAMPWPLVKEYFEQRAKKGAPRRRGPAKSSGK